MYITNQHISHPQFWEKWLNTPLLVYLIHKSPPFFMVGSCWIGYRSPDAGKMLGKILGNFVDFPMISMRLKPVSMFPAEPIEIEIWL